MQDNCNTRRVSFPWRFVWLVLHFLFAVLHQSRRCVVFMLRFFSPFMGFLALYLWHLDITLDNCVRTVREVSTTLILSDGYWNLAEHCTVALKINSRVDGFIHCVMCVSKDGEVFTSLTVCINKFQFPPMWRVFEVPQREAVAEWLLMLRWILEPDFKARSRIPVFARPPKV